MDVKIANAAAAYAARLNRVAAPPKPEVGDASGAAGSFDKLVKTAVESAVKSAKEGEAVTMHSLVNPGDLGSVVTAVSSAEVTMQTVVAVRDRVVQAYQDILRMPI